MVQKPDRGTQGISTDDLVMTGKTIELIRLNMKTTVRRFQRNEVASKSEGECWAVKKLVGRDLNELIKVGLIYHYWMRSCRNNNVLQNLDGLFLPVGSVGLSSQRCPDS